MPHMNKSKPALRPCLYLAGALLVSAASDLHAQSSVNGAFGSRNLGGAFSSGGSPFGGSGVGGAAGGMGGFGGMGGTVAGATQRGDTTAGTVTGSERFVRTNRQAGQFVGTDAADAASAFNQMAAFSMMNQAVRNNTQNPNRNNSSTAKSPQARVQTTIGFVPPLAAPTRISATLQNRLTKSARIEKRGPILVRMEGRTAVLIGQVATEHDRVLAEQVALLEAGVSAVRNELLAVTPLPRAPDALPQPPEALPPSKVTVPATPLPQLPAVP